MNLDSVFFVVNIRSRQGMSDGISCFFYKNRNFAAFFELFVERFSTFAQMSRLF